ncbi:MAG: FkbM family methyltransferase [Proteobacteria bacterium]|nr:FkbM family methyltransferase [Pseudomonadota bacterium]
MKIKSEKLRAYYRFKDNYSMGSTILPWVRKREKSSLKKNVVKELVRTCNNFLVPVSSIDSATRHVQVRGSIDLSMEWIIKRYVKQGTVAVDVGANLGFLSLCMAERVGYIGKVYSIEPNRNLHPYIRELLYLNAIKNVEIVNCACSDEEGIVKFEIDESDHSKSRIGDKGEYEIKVMPLDTILEEIDNIVSFIKVDVEGHEPSVLAGAIKTLKSDRPTLVFETGTHSESDISKINRILEDTQYDVIGVIKDWGIEEKALTVRMTNKTHCNVLALPRRNQF